MKRPDLAAAYIQELKTCLESIDLEQVDRVVAALQAARRGGHCVYLAGNGGSAATASHLASDLTRGASGAAEPALRAIALADNTAAFTAMANDHGYDNALAELLALQARSGDLLFAISGSGKSANILRAVEVARQRGLKTIGLVGFGGGDLLELVDHAICVKTRHYGVVEAVHLAMGHIIARLVGAPERVAHTDRRPPSVLGGR